MFGTINLLFSLILPAIAIRILEQLQFVLGFKNSAAGFVNIFITDLAVSDRFGKLAEERL